MIRYAFKTSAWLPTESEWLLAANTISEPERTRISQFMFKRDAKQSMAGRLLMRTCFSRITGDVPESFVLSRDESGKPYLADPLPGLVPLSFNVSHAGDYAVFVASTSARVGVDVMKVELRRNTTVQQFFHHMTRQFTEFEWSRIQAPTTDHGKLINFYRHWCLKESFVKTIGTGLKFGLQRIEFDIGPISGDVCKTTTVAIDGSLDNNWVFEEIFLDDHFITTAINGDVTDSYDLDVKPVTELINILKFNDLLLNRNEYFDKEYFATFDKKKECP